MYHYGHVIHEPIPASLQLSRNLSSDEFEPVTTIATLSNRKHMRNTHTLMSMHCYQPLKVISTMLLTRMLVLWYITSSNMVYHLSLSFTLQTPISLMKKSKLTSIEPMILSTTIRRYYSPATTSLNEMDLLKSVLFMLLMTSSLSLNWCWPSHSPFKLESHLVA